MTNAGKDLSQQRWRRKSSTQHPGILCFLLDALQVMHHWSVGREYDRRENGEGKFCSHGTCSQSHNGAASSFPTTATCALGDSDSSSTSYSSIWHIPLYKHICTRAKISEILNDMKEAEQMKPIPFLPNLLRFFSDWFSKLSVTPIMQVCQPYRLNDSSLFFGFQYHCKAWKNEF